MTIFSPCLPFILSISLSLSLSFFFSLILPSLHRHHLLLRSFLGLGLGLVTAIAIVTVKKPPHPVNTDAPRHVHDIGGLVADGFASCTESLGFECPDESRLMDQLENRPAEDSCWAGMAADIGAEICMRTSHRVRKEARSFPPPLSSLNLNGQPSFFLRAVRKDGSLKLTEVRIHRPKILHARRHHGRLTLHFIPEEEAGLDDLEDDWEEEEEELEEEEEEEGEEVEEEIVRAMTDDKEEEFRFGDWKFGNEGLRRCHQELNGHGGHDHHFHKHPLRLQMPGVGIA